MSQEVKMAPALGVAKKPFLLNWRKSHSERVPIYHPEQKAVVWSGASFTPPCELQRLSSALYCEPRTESRKFGEFIAYN